MNEINIVDNYLEEVKTCILQNKACHLYLLLHQIKQKYVTLETQQYAFYIIMDGLIYAMNLTMMKYVCQHFFNEWTLNIGLLNDYAYTTGYPSLFWTAWCLYDNATAPFFKKHYFDILLFVLNNPCGYVRRDDLLVVKEALLEREECDQQQLLMKRVDGELSVFY